MQLSVPGFALVEQVAIRFADFETSAGHFGLQFTGEVIAFPYFVSNSWV